jgi:hypothetical protein
MALHLTAVTPDWPRPLMFKAFLVGGAERQWFR